jgi:hypothetical protein
MRNRNTRRSPPPDSFEILCELGDKLRDEFGPVRYVTRIIHTGDQWTVEASWERLVGDQWEAFDLPILNY